LPGKKEAPGLTEKQQDQDPDGEPGAFLLFLLAAEKEDSERGWGPSPLPQLQPPKGKKEVRAKREGAGTLQE
jgi:hypothetical protein